MSSLSPFRDTILKLQLCMPSSPYITEMIPSGYSADGNLTFKMTGFFAEVFDNLQVSGGQLTFKHNQ